MNFYQTVSHLSFAIRLPFLLLLSGFAGISYEILYGRLLGNLIGDQFAVSASVLITFLLGSGWGAAYAYRLRAWLWLVELGIGLCGVLFAVGYGVLESLLYAHYGLLSAGLGGQVLLCCLLLITPAFLVGCSVPLFADYCQRNSSLSQFARVYTIYNFGAAATALGLEFLLIRAVGIQGALWCFAAVNLYVAFWLRVRISSIEPAPPPAEASHWPATALLALALASVASAAYQLFMLKWAELVFGPFRENFALVLAWVLLGIALGTALMRKFSIGFARLMAANLLGLAILLAGTGWAVHGYAAVYPQLSGYHTAIIGLKGTWLLLLMALPSLTFGATVPALLQGFGNMAKDSGRLLFVSALANSAGFLLMVFVLHQYWDYGEQLLMIAGLSLAAWLVCQRFSPRRLCYAAMAMAGLLWVHRQLWDEDLLYLSYTSFHSPEELREVRSTFKAAHTFKGYQDIFSVTWFNGAPHFFINGYISFPLNSPSERVVGLIASFFSPRTDQALVLGLGSGSTASVVGLAFDHSDAVEINPAVRANLYRLKEWNFDIEHNAKVNIIVDDAIHYLRRADKTYSLILNTVTSPLYFSSSKLYTDEFFRSVARHLSPDGVYATWLDSRVGDRGFDITLQTLKQNFAHCAIFYIKTTYFLLLCGQQPLAFQQPRLAERAPPVWQELREKYYLLPEGVPYQLLSTQAFSLLTNTDTPVNRLDLPVLEFEMAGLARKGIPAIKEHIRRLMDTSDVCGALPGPDTDTWGAANWVVQAERVLGHDAYITRRWRELAKSADSRYREAHDEAELNYFSRLAAGAGSAKAYHKYGYQLLERQREHEALVQFERALAINPRYDNTYFNMGVAYERLGDKTKAEDFFQRELVNDPGDSDALLRLGRLYIDRGEFEKGLFYLMSVTGKPNGKAILYRAQAYQGLGKMQEAARWYAMLLADSEANPALRQEAQQGMRQADGLGER